MKQAVTGNPVTACLPICNLSDAPLYCMFVAAAGAFSSSGVALGG